jgi:pilus assembly protein CpaB
MGGIIAAVVLALIGIVLVLAYAGAADDRAKEGQKVVKVYAVISEIPAGTNVADLGDRVAKKEIPRNVVADGAITNLSQIKGLVSGALLVKGEQLVRARFTSPSSFQSNGVAVAIPAGFITTTISLSPERAVGGLLIPGTTVAVAASFAGEGTTPAQTGVILQRVLVTNVQVADPAAVQSADTSEDPTLPGASPQGSLLITLAIDPANLNRLIYAAENGTIWLAGDPKTALEAPGGATSRNGIYQ